MNERIYTGYSVGKVRVPAGLSNRMPADAMLSIEQQFWLCQGENDTLFGGIKVSGLVVGGRFVIPAPQRRHTMCSLGNDNAQPHHSPERADWETCTLRHYKGILPFLYMDLVEVC